MSTEKTNMELMQSLDDAWNKQDWDTGPMVMGDKTIAPNGKRFEVDFCTVARWHDGQIVEENLFYDVVGMMSQLGLK